MARVTRSRHSRWRLARIVSQCLFLLLFLFLFVQTQSRGHDDLGWPVKLFLDFDPLILLTTLLSSHTASGMFYLSIITAGLTVLLGRFFCGWACPLGALNSLVSRFGRRGGGRLTGWFRLKYAILVFLVAASVFGTQLSGLLDPISLLIRSLSLSVYPLLSLTAFSFFDMMFEADMGSLTAASESVYSAMKASVLPFAQPHYMQSAFIGALFIGILALNLYERRFWCRYLCPLGALLGVLSRYGVLRRSVTEGCIECGACARVCHGAASPDMKGGWRPAECYYCMNCDDPCPSDAVRFGFAAPGAGRPVAGMDLGRRRLVTSIVAGAVAVPFLRSGQSEAISNPELIRPPGSLAEREFLMRCVRCGECMKVCITNGLQPTLFEAGAEGIWTPMLVPRIGYCEHNCTLCGQVCPTGAIERLYVERKRKVRIGLAMVDRSRCLPYAHSRQCIVCEEVCPTAKKAIWLEEAETVDRDGVRRRLQRPRVDLELCIGCGVCEAKCPVIGRPAITVTSLGESRTPKNTLLIEDSYY